MKLGKRSGAALAAAALLAATGCATQEPGTGGTDNGAAEGEVQTGRGVSGDEITLGVLTDLTGTFAALGADITNAQSLFWEARNAEGGVCDQYTVRLEIRDTGYVPQQGVQLYSAIRDNVLAMQQTIGSPINAALEEQYRNDTVVNLPSAWARTLADYEGNIVPGALYDIESINILGHAMEEGLINEGDTIGHIYFTGEYGENGLAGAEWFAEENGMTLLPAEIRATDTDMSAQITQFRAAGVDAIMLTTGPAVTASVATVSAAQGLRVPLLGNNPVFAPGLMTGPAAGELAERLRIASPTTGFRAFQELYDEYRTRFNVQAPSLGLLVGYGMADIMAQVLEQACENGNLTPEGLLEAKNELTSVQPSVDDEAFMVELNLAAGEGESPSNQSYILQPAADVPGNVQRVVEEPYEAEGVADFQPHS
jgi:ABC-type branched-subunit amino acid transport system substrate-binding protein